MNDTNPQLAEEYVLSAMMRNVKAVWDVIDVIPGLQMIAPKHETIAQVIRDLAERGDPTDVIATVDELTRRNQLNLVGGVEYLHHLDGVATTWTNAAYYAEIVAGRAARDRLLVAAEKARTLANDPSVDPAAAADQARAAIEDAVGVDRTEGDEDLDQAFLDVLDAVGTTSPGYPTPWPELTRRLNGIAPGRVYTIGARPSLGKSAIALQFAGELERHGHVGYFSLEMSSDENRLRQISQQNDLALHNLTSGAHLPEWMDLKARQWAIGRSSQILFDDRGTITVAEMRRTIRTWQRKFHLSGVVIDYLQLITPSDDKANRVQQVSEMSRQIKLIAKDFNVPVILLSQLNRALETRADKTPMLADFRESGAVEQDADVVIMLHRNTTPDDNGDLDPLMHFMIMKNRNGPVTTVSLVWEGDFTRAVETTRYDRD